VFEDALNESSLITGAGELSLHAVQVRQEPLLGYATIFDAEYRDLVDPDLSPRGRLAKPPTLIGAAGDVVNHDQVSLGNNELDVFAPVWKRVV
jgi:hypothetical protein